MTRRIRRRWRFDVGAGDGDPISDSDTSASQRGINGVPDRSARSAGAQLARPSTQVPGGL